MKLVLGSAQFGLDYGITNSAGQVSKTDALEILKQAKASGISLIDTAVAYGDSEQTLGDICSEIGGFDFISKIQLDLDSSPENINTIIDGSCSRLRTEKLYGLMVHNADTLLDKQAAEHWDELIKLKQQGKIEKIGVSVYSPEHARKILQRFKIDIIQIPCNLLDQRFIQSGVLKELKIRDVEVHCRSIFLQGLLLCNYETLPKYFSKAASKLQMIERICYENGLSKLDIVVAFIKEIKEIDGVVFGVTAINELAQVLDTLLNGPALEGQNFEFDRLAMSDKEIIDPSLWKLN